METNRKASRGFSRRDFMKSTAAQAAATVLAAPAALMASGANGRVRVGLIGTGGRGQTHLDLLLGMHRRGLAIEPAAVCDVFTRHRQRAKEKLESAIPGDFLVTTDYRDVLARSDIDAVCIATPDHWHAKIATDALAAGKHVYCEMPMVHALADAPALVSTWQASQRVMQVGVQRTSDGRYREANRAIQSGKIGQVLHAQTEYFRNSGMGQWRYIGLSRDMSPRNIDWAMFLGREFDLAPQLKFDRALFAQWRCYWPLGSGLFGDLFVPRLTPLLVALGLGYPRRVVCTGGIFLEYDGRDVPDTATLVADYAEGCQVLVTSTLGNDHPIETCIRGHHGTLRFDLSRDGFDFIPQRPQVTRQRGVNPEHISAFKPADETEAHWENFLAAVLESNPARCHNPPDLAAAAAVTAYLGRESYLRGQVLEWDAIAHRPRVSGSDYARDWETRSRTNTLPRPQSPNDYQKLAGEWADDQTDPA